MRTGPPLDVGIPLPPGEAAGFDGPTLLLVGSVALQARGAEPIRDGLRQSAAR